MRTLPTFVFTAVLFAAVTAQGGDFGAYYTKIRSGEPFEQFSRTGPHADVVVDLGNESGRLVFWRGSSYLPYWQTDRGKWYAPEVIPRRGDGQRKMPDRVNTYSRVAIIESTSERVVVHWRYLPSFGGVNPHTRVAATGFVDEYFVVSPDGNVTRTIKEGTTKFDAWNDPLNHRVQKLRLTATGIVDEGIKNPPPPRSPEPVTGNAVKSAVVGTPRKHWRFDEAAGNETVESVAGDRCSIVGPKSFWKRGISGTALHFDGYNSLITLPARKAPAIKGALTLEAWIAIGAYPWNWCPIVQQGDGDDDGYFLGVDGHAHVGLKIHVNGSSEELTSEMQLKRNRWYHVAGTFDRTSGTMRIFVDGQEDGRKSVARADVDATRDDIKIGQGKSRRPVDPVRANTFVDAYAFDGLIDELKIHDAALSPEQVAEAYRSLRPSDSIRDHPDMDTRVLPAGEATGKFGARYTHLQFYETWDAMWRFGDHPDVVVEFDELPARFVFWRGTGFIPMLVNEKGQWYSNEFNETWGTSGGKGCQEPMSDKEGHTNHARIIENTPARVVVQWRYPLLDVLRVTANFNAETGWGDWSDWYFTIYPDGVAVKRMRLWTHGRRNHEWQESMAIFGPDQHPEKIIETRETLMLADLEGHHKKYDWVGGPPRIRGSEYRDKNIHLVNYKANFDPFTIGEFVGGDVYGGELTPYAVFPTWNHWPVAQMPSDGRYASFPDRTAHSSLTHVRLKVSREDFGDTPFEERLLMEGMTDRDALELVPLARSWLRPPPLEITAGCGSDGFDRSQRAYPLVARAASLGFKINASEQSPIVNPCFVIRNWGNRKPAVMNINGSARADGADTRQGTIRDTDGTYTKVVWLRLQARSPVSFTISGATPDLSGPTPTTMEWGSAPQVVGQGLAIAMEAKPALHPSGVEYYFGEVSGQAGARDSGWQTSREFTVTGLAPNTTYVYRAKARNRLHVETEWTAPAAATTGDLPGPVAHWTMDNVPGKAVTDGGGRHHGTIQGRVRQVDIGDRQALEFDGKSAVLIARPDDLPARGNFTWTAWIKTEEGGTIIARAGPDSEWAPGGQVLFVREGRLVFDVGWVGDLQSNRSVSDGDWHHVAVTVDSTGSSDVTTLYVDGRAAGTSRGLGVRESQESGMPVKIGYCNIDFPRPQSGFVGLIDDVRWYGHALTAPMVKDLYAGK